MLKTKLRIFVILVTLPLYSFAKSSSSGYWVGIFPQMGLGSNQHLSLQAEYRELGKNSIGLFRPSFHKVFSSYFSLGLGYDHFVQESNEQRVWPEIAGHITNDYFIFDWRLRQEIRFKEDDSQTGQRTRLMIGGHFKVSSLPKYIFYVFNEAFWSQQQFNGREQEWDRNWIGTRVRRVLKDFHCDAGLFIESVRNASLGSYVGTFSVGWKI